MDESIDEIYSRTVAKNKSASSWIQGFSTLEIILVLAIVIIDFYVLYAKVFTDNEAYLFLGLTGVVIILVFLKSKGQSLDILDEPEAKAILLKYIKDKRDMKLFYPQLCDIPDGDILFGACNLQFEASRNEPLWWTISFDIRDGSGLYHHYVAEMMPYSGKLKALYLVKSKPNKKDLQNIKLLMPPDYIVWQKLQKEQELKNEIEAQRKIGMDSGGAKLG
jgi:hypothetical protein